MAEEWIGDLENEWKSTTSTRQQEIQQRRCIYRVPKFARDPRDDSYTPHVVSLGPYHHGSEHLKGMERIKRRVLGCYLAKINKSLKDSVGAIGARVRELMDAYDGLEEPWTDEDRFVQLMVLDGCYLLQLLYFIRELEDDEQVKSCFRDITPMSSSIFRDMMLLENQVPLLALQILADLGGDKVPTRDVSRILLRRAASDFVFSVFGGIEFMHELHAFWISRLIGCNFLFKTRYTSRINPPTITELVEGGVRVERAEGFCVSFEKGVLELPQFTFDDNVESLCLNLMAFEKMLNLDPEYFSYIEFMDCLVDTGEDVAILRRKGIIDGGTGSDDDVAAFFNSITRGVYPPPRNLRRDGIDVAKLLTEHCGKWQNKARASFKRLYLANLWVFISLLGALFLLALTVISTVYTTLSYYKQ